MTNGNVFLQTLRQQINVTHQIDEKFNTALSISSPGLIDGDLGMTGMAKSLDGGKILIV